MRTRRRPQPSLRGRGHISRSPLEDDFRPWLKRYGLPEPQYNVKLGPYEADVFYPGQRVIIELDGWQFHRTKAAFENDRERDAYMLARGIVTVRITRDRLRRAPAKEAERLLTILNSRGTLTDLSNSGATIQSTGATGVLPGARPT